MIPPMCLAIDNKKFIHLRHDPDRALIFGIDFEPLEELSPGMRPARCVDDSGSADMIIGSVAIALSDCEQAFVCNGAFETCCYYLRRWSELHDFGHGERLQSIDDLPTREFPIQIA